MKINPYELYEAAVIDAKHDVRLFRRFFLEINRTYPEKYREDFAGTFKHAVEWVKCNRRNRAWAIDLDPCPLQFGRERHWSKLSDEQKRRIQILRQDVRKKSREQMHFITAMNFSYCIFKERELLKEYFQSVYKSLHRKGLFLLDVMGGSRVMDVSEDKTVIPKTRSHPRLTYYWEQKSFDGFSHHTKFGMHFKVGNSKRRLKNVFTYDWRLWTMPELIDLLKEAGFKKTFIYGEGTRRDGTGTGIYKQQTYETDCLVWVSYLIAEK